MAPREQRSVKPLMVKLELELKRRFKLQATRDESDMSKVTRRLILEYLERAEGRQPDDEVVRRMAGTATTELTTDEIMALTRGD